MTVSYYVASAVTTVLFDTLNRTSTSTSTDRLLYVAENTLYGACLGLVWPIQLTHKAVCWYRGTDYPPDNT